MVFNRKGSFFLNLDEKAPAAPATIAPVAKPAAKSKEAVSAKADTTITVAAGAAGASSEAKSEAAPAASGPVLTTAEAIAAELAADQAAKPAVSLSTFAPDCVTAGGALPMRRRSGGANLAGFRSMAGSLFGKK